MSMLAKIRRMHFRDGVPLRDIARQTGLSRNTIRRWLREPSTGEPKYFEASIGLPGRTVDIIKEACSRCDAQRYPRWEEKLLMNSMPSTAAHKKLLKETVIGEMEIERFLRTGKQQIYTSEDVVKSEILHEQSSKRGK